MRVMRAECWGAKGGCGGSAAAEHLPQGCSRAHTYVSIMIPCSFLFWFTLSTTSLAQKSNMEHVLLYLFSMYSSLLHILLIKGTIT